MNSVETAPPTFWVGESGVRSSGNSSSSPSQPAQPEVEVGVGEGRVVEHVVAPARVVDLLAQLTVTLLGLGSRRLRFAHAPILPTTADIHHPDRGHPSGGSGVPNRSRGDDRDRPCRPARRHRARLGERAGGHGAACCTAARTARSAPVTGRSLSWQRGAALGRTLARRLHDDGVGRAPAPLPHRRLERRRRRQDRRRPLGAGRHPRRARRAPRGAARALDGRAYGVPRGRPSAGPGRRGPRAVAAARTSRSPR